MIPRPYKYDLPALEADLRAAYAAMMRHQSDKTRTTVFVAIRELGFAVLSVGDWGKYKVDYEITAYEHALHLFQRIVTGDLVPKSADTFPWQAYFRKSLKHVVITMRADVGWADSIRDMSYLLDGSHNEVVADQSYSPDHGIDHACEAERLLLALQMFYGQDEITRMIPLATESIFGSERYLIPPTLPDDLHSFCVVLVSVAKRLYSDNSLRPQHKTSHEDLKRAFSSAVRSSVFLASVVNTDVIPKELLLSLDTDSLFRLVQVAGGRTIKVPTQETLDSVLGAVVSVSKVILEGKSLDTSFRETKKDLELRCSNRINLSHLAGKVVRSFELFGEDGKTEPVLCLILSALSNVEQLFSLYMQRCPEPAGSDDGADRVVVAIDRFRESVTRARSVLSGTSRMSGGV